MSEEDDLDEEEPDEDDFVPLRDEELLTPETDEPDDFKGEELLWTLTDLFEAGLVTVWLLWLFEGWYVFRCSVLLEGDIVLTLLEGVLTAGLL